MTLKARVDPSNSNGAKSPCPVSLTTPHRGLVMFPIWLLCGRDACCTYSSTLAHVLLFNIFMLFICLYIYVWQILYISACDIFHGTFSSYCCCFTLNNRDERHFFKFIFLFKSFSAVITVVLSGELTCVKLVCVISHKCNSFRLRSAKQRLAHFEQGTHAGPPGSGSLTLVDASSPSSLSIDYGNMYTQPSTDCYIRASEPTAQFSRCTHSNGFSTILPVLLINRW